MQTKSLRLVAVTLALTILAAAAGAQVPPAAGGRPRPQPQDPTPMPAPHPQRGTAIVVTGCLQRVKAAPASPESGAPDSTAFVLERATLAGAGAAARQQQADGEAGGQRSYVLAPSSARPVNLEAHVGRQVEVTGVIVPLAPPEPETGVSSSRPAGSTGVSTLPGGDRTAAQAGPALAVIEVQSITQVATVCSASR
jgi:hypothetical protein